MMSQYERIEAKLKRFIGTEILDESHGDIDALATDSIDSLGLEQLAGYIDREFGVNLLDGEMTAKNFESISVLAAFIDARQRAL